MNSGAKKKMILCVDDDPNVLLSLKSQLKLYYEDRYLYEMAAKASEAFEIIENAHKEGVEVAIIISDWLLEGMKGDEFLILVHQKYPKISTVLLTGRASDEAIENTKIRANLLTCLNKPWSLEDLVNVIEIANRKN